MLWLLTIVVLLLQIFLQIVLQLLLFLPLPVSLSSLVDAVPEH